MKNKIPYGKQNISKSDISEIVKVLRSDYLTTGPRVRAFQKKIVDYTGAKFAAVCNSGTSALHLAFLSVGLKKNDVVIMPGINFIASFNICKLISAKIYLADVNSITGRMEPKNVLECKRKNKIRNLKVLITMHLGGRAENIDKFYNIKKKYKCFIIEDSCHALGSEYFYKNKKFKVGCGRHADLSTFSFHPIKSITTAEGGAITTNNKKLFEKISLLISHGMVRKDLNKHWSYNILFPGYNFRLSDLNCSLGINQLNRISRFMLERKKIARFYYKKLKEYHDFITLPNIDNIQCAWHLYIVNFKFKNFKHRENFFSYLNKNKIVVQYHYIPIYRFSVAKGFKKLKGCEDYYKSAVSLPIFVGLKISQQLKIIEFILKFFKRIS